MGAAVIWVVCMLAAMAQSQRSTEQVILLPSFDGQASAVIITTATGGQTVLDAPYRSGAIASNGTVTLADGDAATLRARYATLLAALPQRAAVFVLYFDTATDELVPESKARLEQIRAELALRPVPEIIVIGHTDTVDQPAYNDALSLKRAGTVRQMLIAVGIAPEQIEAQGRGERELLVPTGDKVDEPRNRRVEIRVR